MEGGGRYRGGEGTGEEGREGGKGRGQVRDGGERKKERGEEEKGQKQP